MKNEIQRLFKRYRISNYINKNFEKMDTVNAKNIYFPLQFEPERSTLISAPYLTNQLDLITNISKSIPIEYTLLVKEHPLMKSVGWRDIKFYKEVLKLPNVKLIHPMISSERLIENSSLVITIVGTTGLEAAFNKKPSIVLRKTIYSILPSVFVVKPYNHLSKTIKIALNTSINEKDLNHYIDTIEQNSFEPATFELNKKLVNLFYYEGFTSNANFSIEKMIKFLEENKEELSILSSEFIKRIETE